jgi:hypothetical protein
VVLEPSAAGACFLVTLPIDPPSGPEDGAEGAAADIGIWEPGEVAKRG